MLVSFYRTFAYLTIKDRLPAILTKVIDQFSRLASKYHDEKKFGMYKKDYDVIRPSNGLVPLRY